MFRPVSIFSMTPKSLLGSEQLLAPPKDARGTFGTAIRALERRSSRLRTRSSRPLKVSALREWEGCAAVGWISPRSSGA